jgi:hypothetical protein
MKLNPFRKKKHERRSRYGLIFFVVVLILLLPLLLKTLRHAQRASAAWFDEGWSYRQRIDISNSSGSTQSNFQVQLSFNTSALVTAGKLQTNCNDLRITDQGGNLLPFWIEPTTCNTTTTKIWVKVTSIPTAGAPLYLYYSNPSSPSGSSNPSTVFIREMNSATVSWPLDDTTATQSYSRVLNPAVSLGRNILLNGTFDSAGSWDLGTNWTITGGHAHSNGTNVTDTYLYLTAVPVNGSKTYQITFTISNYVAGTAVGFVNNTRGVDRTGNGTYTEYILGVGNTPNSGIVSKAGFIGDIDDIIIKEVNIPSSGSTPTNLLTDGNMETAGTGSWTGFNAAIVSKQTTTPHTGSQYLRVAYNGTNSPYTGQTVLTPGLIYRIYGYMRSDGSATPRIAGAIPTTNGTTSTQWQPFDFVFVSTGTQVQLMLVNGSAGQYVEFDDVTVSLDNSLRPGELIQDGDMETSGTSYWPVAINATITKENTSPHGGTWNLKVAYNGTIYPSAYNGNTVVTGKKYRITGWFRGDGTWTPLVVHGTTGATIISGTSSNTWQFFDTTTIAQSSNILFRSNATSAGYAEFDDISVTEIDPLIGQPANGVTLGSASGGHLTNAYTFDGTNDYVNILNSDLNSAFNPDEGTIVTWAKVTNAGVWTDGTVRYLIRFAVNGTNTVEMYKNSSNNVFVFSYYATTVNSGVTNTSFNPTGWQMYVLTWSKTSDQVKAYINGTQVGSTQTGLGTFTGNLAADGSIGKGGSLYWSGLINDVRLYTRALSSDEIADLYSSSSDRQAYYTENYPGKELVRLYNTGVTVAAPATEEGGGGPSVYWKFDDGSGQVVLDSTSNRYNGTLGANSSVSSDDPTWTTEDQCVSGKCLKFDGGDVVTTSFTTSNGTNAGPFTINAWVKASTGYVFSQSDSSGGSYRHRMYISSGTLTWEYADGAGGKTITAPWTTDTWHYISAVKDGPNIIIYLDGKLISSTACATSTDVGTLYLGSKGVGNTFLTGFMDDVKVYKYARTAAQIKADFNGRGTTNGAAAAVGNSPTIQLSNGLVGYWKMDEASWNGTASEIKDASGNGNNGVSSCAGGGCTKLSTITGKFGNGAGTFSNAVNQFLNMGSSASLAPGSGDYTVSVWTYYDGGACGAGGCGIIGTNQSYVPSYKKGYSYLVSGASYVLYFGDSTNFVNATIGTVTANQWQHSVLVFDRTNNKITTYINGAQSYSGTFGSVTGAIAMDYYLHIGSRDYIDNNFSGNIDEVRVYNRALSPAEVTTLYNFAPGPVGWWKLDEASGTVANDSSGNGYNGTISNPLWMSGKIGSALRFDGNINTNVSMGNVLNLTTIGSISVSAWVMRTANVDTVFVSKESNISFDSPGYSLFAIAGDNSIRAMVADGTNSAQAIAATTITNNTWYHLEMVYDRGNSIKIYVNGALSNSNSSVGSIGSLSTGSNLIIGRSGSSGRPVVGLIDDVRIYNYPRTPTQVLEDMQAKGALSSAPPSPIGYWKLDEGSGTTAFNSGTGGTTLNGTLSGFASPATATSGWIATGKIGKALAFDGTNDYVDLGDLTATEVVSQLTFSTWIKPNTQTLKCILCKFNNDNTQTGWGIEIGYGGNTNILAYLPTTLTDGVTFGFTALGSISLNQWQQVTMVYDGTQTGNANRLKVYINGILQTMTFSGTIPATTLATSSNARIGATSDGARFFSGQMDSVKIYPYALTADQVKTDYNAGSSTTIGTKTASGSNLLDGLVGWWKLDETAGNAADSSGNGNTGTWNGTGTSHYTAGKFAGGAGFNGTDDYISTNLTSSTNTFTWSSWVYPTAVSNDQMFLGQGASVNSAFYFRINSSKAYVSVRTTDGGQQILIGTTVLQNNTWYLLTTTFDGTYLRIFVNGKLEATSSSITVPLLPWGIGIIGKWTTTQLPFTGTLDDIRIYNRALSASEVTQLYGSGPNMVAYWNFDEGSGTSVSDTSGNNNTGTWNGTGSHWSSGKFNSAGSLNGTSDYVSIPYNAALVTQTYTVSAWIHPTGWYTGRCLGNMVVSSGDDGSSNWSYQLDYAEMGADTCNGVSNGIHHARFFFRGSDGSVNNAEATTDLKLNTWYFLTGTYDGSSLKIYINGNLETTTSVSKTVTASNVNFLIGKMNNATYPYYVKGQIDDVRIYNYARSAAQIAADASGKDAPTGASPVAWYKMDECQGTTINDSSGNGNTGTLTVGGSGTQTSPGTCTTASTAWGNGASGKYNSSLNFDNTDDYVDIGNGSSLPTTSSGATLSVWIYPTSGNDTGGLISNDYTLSSKKGWDLFVWSDGNVYCDFGNGTIYSRVSAPYSATTWALFTCTYDGSNVNIYKNGTFVASTALTGPIAASGLSTVFGNIQSLMATPYNGKMDDVRIYNYALTTEQVKNLFNGGAAVRFGP